MAVSIDYVEGAATSKTDSRTDSQVLESAVLADEAEGSTVWIDDLNNEFEDDLNSEFIDDESVPTIAAATGLIVNYEEVIVPIERDSWIDTLYDFWFSPGDGVWWVD